MYGSGKKDESLSRILLETENLYTVNFLSIHFGFATGDCNIERLNNCTLFMNFLLCPQVLTYRAYFATAENDGVTEASCRQALDKVYTTVLSPVSELGQNQTLQLAQSLMSEEGSALLDTLSKMQTPHDHDIRQRYMAEVRPKGSSMPVSFVHGRHFPTSFPLTAGAPPIWAALLFAL
mgnify:CR=1 FL=1